VSTVAVLALGALGGGFVTGLAGFGGGALGGVAGLSGPLPTIWCGLRGGSPDTQRGVYQSFNLTILGLVLCVYATRGVLTREVWGFAPVSGRDVARRVPRHPALRPRERPAFRAVVLWLLLASGVVLMVSNLR